MRTEPGSVVPLEAVKTATLTNDKSIRITQFIQFTQVNFKQNHCKYVWLKKMEEKKSSKSETGKSSDQGFQRKS